MSELTAALNETAQENDNHRVTNQALANSTFQLQATLGKQREEVEQLKAVISKFENSLEKYKENEQKLNTTINEQQQEFVEQQKKFNQAGNPDYEAVLKLENAMMKKLEQVGNGVKLTLLQQVRDSNKKMEEKLHQVITENKSYAETLQKGLAAVGNQSKTETKNSELVQEKEKQLRSSNIHGVSEETENGKEKDEDFVNGFFGKLGIEYKPVSTVRLGNPDPNKTRPLKLKMGSEDEKEKIMLRLPNLKNAADRFRKVSVTEAYSIEEWIERTKEQNRTETREIVWKLRGTPKNGFEIKQFSKRTRADN